jgi:hypothetical protein
VLSLRTTCETHMNGSNPQWWQVAVGVLTIPATLLGLMYTYRLYQKTKLEMHELKLKILEHQRALGIREDRPEPVEATDGNTFRVARTSQSVVRDRLGDVSVLLALLLIPRPQPFPISFAGSMISAAFTAAIAVVIFDRVRSRRRAREYSRLALIASISVIVCGFAVVAFFFTGAVTLTRAQIGTGAYVNVIKGTELTPEGRKLLMDRPYLTQGEALARVGFRSDRIWTARSVRRNAAWFLCAYNAALLAAFSVCVSLFSLWRERYAVRKQADVLDTLHEAG